MLKDILLSLCLLCVFQFTAGILLSEDLRRIPEYCLVTSKPEECKGDSGLDRVYYLDTSVTPARCLSFTNPVVEGPFCRYTNVFHTKPDCESKCGKDRKTTTPRNLEGRTPPTTTTTISSTTSTTTTTTTTTPTTTSSTTTTTPSTTTPTPTTPTPTSSTTTTSTPSTTSTSTTTSTPPITKRIEVTKKPRKQREHRLNKEEVCARPISLSPCGEHVAVYYYDNATQSCQTGDFGACGYPNSFRTKENCERSCYEYAPKPESSIPASQPIVESKNLLDSSPFSCLILGVVVTIAAIAVVAFLILCCYCSCRCRNPLQPAQESNPESPVYGPIPTVSHYAARQLVTANKKIDGGWSDDNLEHTYCYVDRDAFEPPEYAVPDIVNCQPPRYHRT